MIKAELQQYNEYLSQSRAVTTDNAYPLSIVLGLQTGDIYIGDDGEAVLFWHYCGFGYISGNPSEEFLNEVDSSTVYWNASTRFTDGGEFGFGAEIGISTDKLHARGPMGLRELTLYKYKVRGSGQIRS